MTSAASQPMDDTAAQAQVDDLLQMVSQQRQNDTFDARDQVVLRQLVESFADKRGMTRLRIAETLGSIGTPATEVLIDGLRNHDNPVVRRACAKTLTLIEDPTAIPDLVYAALNDPDTVVQGSSIGALARTGEAAAPELLAILANPATSESMKGHAAWGLAFIGSAAKDLLFEAMTSDHVEVRSAVVGAIAKILQEDPEAGNPDALVQALQDPASDVRSEAASALGNLAYKPAVPALIALLQHTEPQTRKAAALALMKVGDSSAMQPLKTAAEQETDVVIKPIYTLAINQLDRQDDDDGWD